MGVSGGGAKRTLGAGRQKKKKRKRRRGEEKKLQWAAVWSVPLRDTQTASQSLTIPGTLEDPPSKKKVRDAGLGTLRVSRASSILKSLRQCQPGVAANNPTAIVRNGETFAAGEE